MTPTLLAGIIAATFLAGAFGYLGFRKDYNATLRRRHINKYRDRLRKLDNIILGLPPNYFPKTLKALVYASIAHSLEHMAQLSGDRSHGEQVQRVKQQLKQLQLQTDLQSSDTLELDSQSLREYKHMLKDLHALIIDFHKEGMLSQKEAEIHLKVVNNVLIGVTLDFYCEAAKRADNGNNKSLALHYYSMAMGQIDHCTSEQVRGDRSPFIAQRISELTLEVENEKVDLGNEEGMLPNSSVVAEWEALTKEEDEWRKNYY
ncbi:MAG: hypothetical protein O2861_15455 [Proteobacteria bacterium]|nr:hypothetical protein [Pseudomonadota bacterium]